MFAELSIDLRQEGESGTIELKAIQNDSEESGEADDFCDDPEIVKLMVDYLYHFDYLPTANDVGAQLPIAVATTPVVDGDSEPDWRAIRSRMKARPVQKRIPPPPLATDYTPPRPTPKKTTTTATSKSRVYVIEHVKVFAMAVKYQVDGLCDLAAAKFKQSAETSWKHDDFAHAISVVHDSTPEDVSQLRDIVSNILHAHFDKLKDKPEVDSVVCSIPHLAYALLKRGGTLNTCTNGHSGKMSTKSCSACGIKWDFCKSCRFCDYCRNCGNSM